MTSFLRQAAGTVRVRHLPSGRGPEKKMIPRANHKDAVFHRDACPHRLRGDLTAKPRQILTLLAVIFLLVMAGCGAEPKPSGSGDAAVPADGVYQISVALAGGSGKASVASPAKLTVKDGRMSAVIVWSSSNYDYMIVGDEKYLPLTLDGGSVFEIPVAALGAELPVLADTVAMSEPHEIAYTLTFDAATLKEVDGSAEGADTSAKNAGSAPEGADTSAKNADGAPEGADTPPKDADSSRKDTVPPLWSSLKPENKLPLRFATEFAVTEYTGGYKLFEIPAAGHFLLVPDGKTVPDGLDPDIAVIKAPPKRIYLAATSAMDFFRALDALDRIRLSGTNADGWYLPEAKEAMEDGRIIFAGKYSAPDFELIHAEGCDLAIESTMIYHTPRIKEQLEGLGIPVLVERSSYEEHPLGRMEWIKFYGALLDCEDLANAIFEEEAAAVEAFSGQPGTGKTAAFFYITSAGTANVRKGDDYVARMIEMAGGSYIFSDLKSGDALSTVNMSLEAFYSGAKDADILIYNSTIDGELQSLRELLEKCPLLEGFKAVRSGDVWCVGKNLFQEPTGLGQLIRDLHRVFSDDLPSSGELTYLHKLTR